MEPVDASVLQEAAKGVVPLKTEQSTQWAVKNFDCWTRSRSSSSSAQLTFRTDAFHMEKLVLHCRYIHVMIKCVYPKCVVKTEDKYGK